MFSWLFSSSNHQVWRKGNDTSWFVCLLVSWRVFPIMHLWLNPCVAWLKQLCEAAHVGTHPSCRLWAHVHTCVCLCVCWSGKKRQYHFRYWADHRQSSSALHLQQWLFCCLFWESCSALWRLPQMFYHRQSSIYNWWVRKQVDRHLFFILE